MDHFHGALEDAFDVLHSSVAPLRVRLGRPDGWIERTLLAHPRAFGEDRAKALVAARECVLRDGDERSRSLLLEADRPEDAERAIARIRRILERRPDARELAAPALVHYAGGELTIALAHPIPAAGSRLAVRIQIPAHPETVHAGARRVDASPELLLRWASLGHAQPPHSVWRCDPPTWCHGQHDLAIEVVPNPSGFSEAMLIAASGAGRVLVTRRDHDTDTARPSLMPASVMPSGWSYLRGDRMMGMDQPFMPHGAPMPSRRVRVPDDDLFALCAAHTWAGSLRDAIWLRRRPDFRLLA
ncbi:MAG: hypothetical protein ACKO0W_06755 [Planctomycetota bacterium]